MEQTRRRRRPDHWARYEEKDHQILRFPASEVAAIAGYHPWTDIPELLMERLLYQDLEHVLQQDAETLGLTLEDRHQLCDKLLHKAGDAGLRTVRTKAGDAQSIVSVGDAAKQRAEAQALLKKAEAKRRLSHSEAEALRRELTYEINTQFGKRNEDEALRQYERRTGSQLLSSKKSKAAWYHTLKYLMHRCSEDGRVQHVSEISKVFGRNNRFLVWPFPGSRNGDDIPHGVIQPPSELSEGWTVDVHKDKEVQAKKRKARKAQRAEDDTFLDSARNTLSHLMVFTALDDIINSIVRDSGCTDNNTGVGGKSKYLDEGQHSSSRIVIGDDGDYNSKTFHGHGSAAEYVAVGGALGSMVPKCKLRCSSTAEADSIRTATELWFPLDLTQRQCTIVQRMADEMGLDHKVVPFESKRCIVISVMQPPQPQDPRAGTAATETSAVGRRDEGKEEPLLVDLPSGGKCEEHDIDANATTPSSLALVNSRILEIGAQVSSSVFPHPHRDSESGYQGFYSSCGTDVPNTLREAAFGEGSMEAVHSAPGNIEGGVQRTTSVADTSQDYFVFDNSMPPDTTPASIEVSPTKSPMQAGVESLRKWITGVSDHDSGNRFRGLEEVIHPVGQCRLAGGAGRPGFNMTEEREDVQEFRVGGGVKKSKNVGRHSGGDDGEDETLGLEDAEAGMGGAEVRLKEGATHCVQVDDMMVWTPPPVSPPPCFFLVGFVDGVMEEVTDMMGEEWKTQKVVVEVKNRMHRAQDPPPLYDQIQLVVYMLMIGASVGDLVQFVKRRRGRAKTRGQCQSRGQDIGGDSVRGSSSDGCSSSLSDEITVSRVKLDCPLYKHHQNWQNQIVPRLYQFARMVYRFRADDLLRWRYLLASPLEQRRVILEHCPFLLGALGLDRRTLPEEVVKSSSHSLSSSVGSPTATTACTSSLTLVDVTSPGVVASGCSNTLVPFGHPPPILASGKADADAPASHCADTSTTVPSKSTNSCVRVCKSQQACFQRPVQGLLDSQVSLIDTSMSSCVGTDLGQKRPRRGHEGKELNVSRDQFGSETPTLLVTAPKWARMEEDAPTEG